MNRFDSLTSYTKSPYLWIQLAVCLLLTPSCTYSKTGASKTIDGGQISCLFDEDCNDQNPCTYERCNEGHLCEYTTNIAACEDGDPCTENDMCDQGVCIPGQNICTCETVSDCAVYEDGDLCNGILICQGAVCIVDTSTVIYCDSSQDTVCSTNTCQPESGQCQMFIHQDDGVQCDDQDPCTEGTTCNQGLCLGAEICCNDGMDNDGDGYSDCTDTDCAGVPECQQECVPVAVPDPVSTFLLPGESIPGIFETTTANGFTDDYVYNQAHTIKIGMRREWGGSIVFFGLDNGSPGMNSTNTIDANDTGREVQVAFYDPDRLMQNCAWNASCPGSDCISSITFLGWNPVQGGNRCNNGSGVDGAPDMTNGVITVSTNPLFWNPNWDRPDCVTAACSDPALNQRRSDVRVIQVVRFVSAHIVELEYTVINLDNIDHGIAVQEMPTVYPANGINGPDLWRIFNSDGVELPIDIPGTNGFFYKDIPSPAGWVTMQNDNLDYGVGMYSENRITIFRAWQNRNLPFNNFRASFAFGIPALGVVRSRSYLMIGAHTDVSNHAAWLDANLPPFGFLDYPGEDASVSGAITVNGWALDNKGVVSIEAIIDGGTPVPLIYGTNRSDVCIVYPQYANCDNVGFEGTVDLTGLTTCPHLLEINAIDSDGNQRIIARQRIYVTP